MNQLLPYVYVTDTIGLRFMAVTRLHVLNMILLLIAGVAILLLSLLTANSLTMRGSGGSVEQWKFYLGRDILPDNILYPVLMIRDRLKLDATSPEEQVFLKIEYANERYKTAEALLERKQELLAISTLTKSQKYLISAGSQALELESFDRTQLQQVRDSLASSVERLDAFSKQLNLDSSIISQLQEESRILILRLDEKLAVQ